MFRPMEVAGHRLRVLWPRGLHQSQWIQACARICEVCWGIELRRSPRQRLRGYWQCQRLLWPERRRASHRDHADCNREWLHQHVKRHTAGSSCQIYRCSRRSGTVASSDSGWPVLKKRCTSHLTFASAKNLKADDHDPPPPLPSPLCYSN